MKLAAGSLCKIVTKAEGNQSDNILGDARLHGYVRGSNEESPVRLATRRMNRGWSNRILALALAGILFLTLYPFRFSLHANLLSNASPLLLATGTKTSGPINAFLNILLFVPFGWGLSQKLREKGQSRTRTLLLTTATGALLSYCIEFMQFYIPTRDSGWEDTFTNALGAGCGFIVFDLLGKRVLNTLSEIESWFERFLTPLRALWIVPIYFIAWFAGSALLQKDSSLSNWIPQAQLVVGNDATGHFDRAWRGEVSRLELWDQPLPDAQAKSLTAGETKAEILDPLAVYELSGNSPYRDDRKFLPELKWIPDSPETSGKLGLTLSGRSWFGTRSAVPNLVHALEKAKRFSIYVVCAPAEAEGADGRIVSISQDDKQLNLSLRQRDKNLVFWFRNPVSVRRDQLTLTIPDVFIVHQARRILVSYDGANLSLYIDGQKDPRRYELTPGAPLAQLVRHIKTNELEGYTYIYYALVFIPVGILLGTVGRGTTPWTLVEVSVMTSAVLLPPALLEILLVRVSGRAFSLNNVLLSVALTIAGMFWINADRGSLRQALATSIVCS